MEDIISSTRALNRLQVSTPQSCDFVTWEIFRDGCRCSHIRQRRIIKNNPLIIEMHIRDNRMRCRKFDHRVACRPGENLGIYE